MEELLKEIEIKLLKDENFKKELISSLISDFINDPKPISFKEIKKRTEDLVKYTAELELQEILGKAEEEEDEGILEN